MNNYQIPSDFLTPGTKSPISTYVHHYQTEKSTVRNRIVLSTHLFCFLTEGTKEVVMSNKIVRFGSESFVLITSGNCFMSEKISQKGAYSSALLFFDHALLQEFHFTYKPEIDRIIKNKNIQNKGIFQFKKDAFTHSFVQSLPFVPKHSAELNRLKLHEILLYLLETQPEELCSIFASAENNNEDLLFKNIIDSNIDSNLTIQELCFICNMSLSTFKRKFTRIFNDSPTSWLRRKRMEHAAFLLSYNKERPSDIYLRLGYESLSSFTQSFKSIYGKTPKEYQLS